MGLKVTPYSNDIAIRKYLDGKTLDLIAIETGLSKGTVYNTIKRWKDNLGNTGIEEMREFATIVSKSGLTNQECIKGFRIAQILKELGVNDEFEELDNSASEQNILEVIRNETIGRDRRKNGYTFFRSPDHRLAKRRIIGDTGAKNHVYNFIEDIYDNCQKNSIKPLDLIEFIKDLFDFYPSLEYEFTYDINKNSDLSLSTKNED